MITLQHFVGPKFSTAGISAILAFIGVLITAFMMHRRVPGSILFGIIFTWTLGIICQITGLYQVSPNEGYFSLFPDFTQEAFQETFTGFKKVFGAAFNVEEWHCQTSGNSGGHF